MHGLCWKKQLRGCFEGVPMKRIREVVVVEGKYDTVRLKSAVDAMVIETAGFGIFKDKKQLELLRSLAEKRGLLILTDSDSAGFVIRNYLSSSIPAAQLKHAYIPEIAGKERRKETPSKEGLLGVEGIDNDVLHLSDAEECYVEDFKPYLRPMSSMTEEERNTFDTMTRGYTVHQQSSLFDWLNAHHFDYRGLISMDLAIEVTSENNPYKE
jgi:ribonuclease M5